ncbi:MAG: enoyl-CoA hydratase/isomerase family protein [Gammaproteobacteria bacterium]|nr:enoyl-CoA hydratase/isomerase family protein [Gammaproteobacteria bacterium]
MRDIPANPALIRGSRPLPRSIGVIGAGTIGPDIAYYLASEIPGLRLVLVDIAPEALARAQERISAYADKGVQRRKLSAERAASIRAGLAPTTDYAELAGCDWVIEAATEDLAVKRRIFAAVEAVVAPSAYLSSNTSSLPASRLFAQLAHPERATVTHFFAPAFQNPIVEVIDWERAADSTIAWFRALFAATGKVPLVTRDAVCFMLDRVFDNWCNEAALLLDRADAAQIDRVAGEFVHAGPFFVLNLANGNPIIVETNTLQAEEEGEHYRPARIFSSVDRWKLPARGAAVPAIDDARRSSIRDRLLGILYSQAADILDRQIGRPADLELGCRLAFGLKRGPLELMRQAGAPEVDRILGRLAEERPGMPRRTRPFAGYVDFRRDVLVDEVDGVCVITLRRPDALNALHDALNDEILSVLTERADDPATKGFVITGYGSRAFCAGADIGRFPAMLGDAAASRDYARACSRLLVALDRAKKPVVAALNGLAFGGGLELALRCHAIVGVRGATLQFPEIGLGIVPGIGGLAVPYRRWPQAAELFHRMLRTAARVDVETAARHGVLERCEDPAALIPTAVARVLALVGRVPVPVDGPVGIVAPAAAPAIAADGAPLSAAVRAIVDQAIVAAAAAPSWTDALEVGYAAFGASACTAAAREGISAFAERRAPDFGKTG